MVAATFAQVTFQKSSLHLPVRYFGVTYQASSVDETRWGSEGVALEVTELPWDGTEMPADAGAAPSSAPPGLTWDDVRIAGSER